MDRFEAYFCSGGEVKVSGSALEEHEILFLPAIKLACGNTKLGEGNLKMTQCRLVWTPTSGQSLEMPICAIKEPFDLQQNLLGRRHRLEFRLAADALPDLKVKLSSSGTLLVLKNQLLKAMEQRFWVRQKATAGVGGIVDRRQNMQDFGRDQIADAFGDLDALMASARRMVMLASSFSEKSAGNSDGAVQFRAHMAKLGLNLVLSDQQIDAGLDAKLLQFARLHEGPTYIISAADLYCRFVRATGVRVSPAEFWQSCTRLRGALTASELLRMKKDRQPVRIVHGIGYTNDGLAANLLPLAPLDSVALATHWPGVGAKLASDLLEHACTTGLLAFDSSTGKFHKNLILSASAE